MMLNNRLPVGETPLVPRGLRAYAVGDIHGRLDLLNELLAKIEQDVESREACRSLLIFLGDLIDRGPDSRGVIERLRVYRHDLLEPHFLAGNHEEVLLRLLSGERGILQSWLKFGGGECIASYGVDPDSLRAASEEEALHAIKAAIPESHSKFIADFSDTLRLGNYLFVHAGIRPGVDLAAQSQTDLRWIRSPFLENEDDHGMIVVHGHTICDGVDRRFNRIGIDTGAYRTGVLTALVVEGDHQSIISTNVAGPKHAARQ